MILHLTPIRHDDTLTLDRKGDVLTVNGEPFDFSPLEDGQTLPASAIGSDWFSGAADRTAGQLTLRLYLPHGADAPEETRFPAPLTLVQDGPVALPPHHFAGAAT